MELDLGPLTALLVNFASRLSLRDCGDDAQQLWRLLFWPFQLLNKSGTAVCNVGDYHISAENSYR